MEGLREELLLPVTGSDSDKGSEFINHDVADWLQQEVIAFTRSWPYKKNDQATVESKNTMSCERSRSTGGKTRPMKANR